MASTSVPSFSSGPNDTHTHIRYDVFLSFRGMDTRYAFTDHLYHALLRAGIQTFRDDTELDRGQQLAPEIQMAIKASRGSIVVLSKNYADSKWCLDELWLIIEQRKMANQFIIPVFYHVEPTDVRYQRGSFDIRSSKGTVDDLRRWKEALREVSNLTGIVLSGYETTCNKDVVETVQRQLDLKQLSTPAHLIGMKNQIELIRTWLINEQPNAIAICGMGGSGKTTLARCIYNLYRHYFESCSFVEEIGKHYKHGLLELQKQLLKDVLRRNEIMISSVSEGTNMIEKVLTIKKVLIVLDDIDDPDELSTLLGTKAFQNYSKIIITTRLLDIDGWFGSISHNCWVHKLKLLNDLESLELLSWHAFGSKVPMEGFEELAKQLAQYCGGNPLALKVLGYSVFVGNVNLHIRNNMIEIWRARLDSLNGNLDFKIQNVLRRSFDSLQLDDHKEMFLDIACFFNGESKEMVTLWQDDLHVKYGVMSLINKSLLTISHESGELVMHKLHQDLGKKIVREESKDPSKRSRLWHDDESYHVLSKEEGSNTIESLALDMQKLRQGRPFEALALKTSSLAKMDKLKFLRLKYVTLNGSYKNFPRLRWLSWHGCPLETVRSGLLKSSLVAVDMSYGQMQTFEVPTVLNSLKILKLKGCVKLVSIDKLHRLPKLEALILCSCRSLTYICKYIEDLKSLSLLDLKGCSKLFKPSSYKKNVKLILKRLLIDKENSEQHLLSLSSSLRIFYLDDCHIEINNHLWVSFHAQSFFNLSLGCNPFEYLPNNIDIKLLKMLNLYNCPNLKSLQCIPSNLEELCIDWCTSLESITFQSRRFSLQHFSYEGCSKLSEVQSLFKLVPIAEIDEAGLVQHMQWIKEFENCVVDLVGDDITESRIWRTQILYEYGIMSTYLQGLNDQNVVTYEHQSPFPNISFRVPLHQKKHRIQGLHVSCLYRSSRSNDKDVWILLAKISNKSKGVTWVYNPLVYCKPKVDEDVVWLSYWPIGNTLDVGDEVTVDIIVEGVIASKCSASLEYVDGEVGIRENNTMQGEEVIGGDLSEFEVTTKGYYLCRRNLFGLETSSWLKGLFDYNVNYPESEGWRKTRQVKDVKLKTGLNRCCSINEGFQR